MPTLSPPSPNKLFAASHGGFFPHLLPDERADGIVIRACLRHQQRASRSGLTALHMAYKVQHPSAVEVLDPSHSRPGGDDGEPP